MPPTNIQEDRISTKMTYQTTNASGQVTIDITITVNDQSRADASTMLLALMEGLSNIPKAQVA